MKIGYISDLHIDNEKQCISAFDIVLNENELDMLLIGGDISNDVLKTTKFISKLNEKVKTYYVVGNHDLWDRENKLSKEEIFELYNNDDNCLFNQVVELEDFKIIGSSGWYDYSYGDASRYTEKDFERKELDNLVWKDKKYANINSDKEFAKQCNDFIEKEIDNTDKKVILLTHIVNHQEFLPNNDRRDWGYFNAFIGNETIHRFTKDEKVKYALCGHAHFRKSFIEDETLYACSCLGNIDEYTFFTDSPDLLENIRDAIKVIEL